MAIVLTVHQDKVTVNQDGFGDFNFDSADLNEVHFMMSLQGKETTKETLEPS